MPSAWPNRAGRPDSRSGGLSDAGHGAFRRRCAPGRVRIVRIESADEFCRTPPPHSREVVLRITLVVLRARETPPQRAARGPSPLSRSALTCRPRRGPAGVCAVARSRCQTLLTLILFLCPSVLVSDRSMIHPRQATVQVVGQLIVFREAPELLLVSRRDPEMWIISAGQDHGRLRVACRACAWLTSRPSAPSARSPRKSSGDRSGRAWRRCRGPRSRSRGSGRFGPPESNQGLALGAFQLQAVAQESPDITLMSSASRRVR